MFENIQETFQLVFFGNPLWKYFLWAGIILLGILFRTLLARLLGFIIYRLFKKRAGVVGVNDFYKLTRKPLGYFILLIFVFIACDQLSWPADWEMTPPAEFGVRMILDAIYQTLLISMIIWLGVKIIDFIGMVFLARTRKDDNKMNDHLIPFAVDILKIVVIALGLFIILGTVFKINIGSLVAGLGIGGLAVALAAKETLENLFGSFTIFIDKPFIIGDWIKVGDTEGIVEKIGFRSTRIRTFERSYVSIPNKKVIDADLDNMTMRTAMRVRFDLGLLYSTKAGQVKKIISDIEDYLKSNEKTAENFKVVLNEFGASSLNIYVLYYVKTDDWGEYMSIKEDINYRIIDIVHENGSDFAYPSTSVYIEKQTRDS